MQISVYFAVITSIFNPNNIFHHFAGGGPSTTQIKTVISGIKTQSLLRATLPVFCSRPHTAVTAEYNIFYIGEQRKILKNLTDLVNVIFYLFRLSEFWRRKED